MVPLVVRKPAEEELQQGALPAAGGAGEGVFAAPLETEGRVLQDVLLSVAEGKALHCDGIPDRGQAVRLPCGLLPGVDGDVGEVGLRRGEREADFGNAAEAVGYCAGQVGGGGYGADDDLALEDQEGRGHHLENLEGESQTVGDAPGSGLGLHAAAGGGLHAVADGVPTAEEAGLLSKKAEDVKAGEEVLQFADALGLGGGAGLPQALHGLLEQLRDDHHHGTGEKAHR